MNNNTRLTLADDMLTAISKISEGNPGALSVCVRLLKETQKIDPDNALGGMGYLLNLDSFGIYGSEIWMLYKDVCGQDITKTIACLRAVQLGLLDEVALLDAIRGSSQICANGILVKVKQQLPDFGKEK